MSRPMGSAWSISTAASHQIAYGLYPDMDPEHGGTGRTGPKLWEKFAAADRYPDQAGNADLVGRGKLPFAVSELKRPFTECRGC